MALNQQDFFIKYNKKFLDADGAYGNQCVDVIKAYCTEVLEVPPIAGNAIDYVKSNYIGFAWIDKTIFNRPNPGDIVVWNIGPFGHTAVVNWSRWLDLGVFEQNNPIGRPCQFRDASYGRLLGWLRPVKKKTWPVLYAGLNQPDLNGFEANVKKYTNNQLSVESKSIPNQISSPVGMPTSEECWTFLDSINTHGYKSVFIFYPANDTSAFFSASYYPSKNITYVTCPLPGSTDVYTHEFLHLFRKWTNANHLGYIEDVEYYPPNWRFEEQYQQLLPIINKL